MKQLYPNDVMLTYESPGMPPLIQLLVCRVYLPPGNLLLYKDSLWREHLELAVLPRLNEEGRRLYKDATFIKGQYVRMKEAEDTLQKFITDFVTKKELTWSDMTSLVARAEEYIIPYRYFDTWFTDGAYPYRDDPLVAAALQCAEESKNVLREDFTAMFFTPGKGFLAALDHIESFLGIQKGDAIWDFLDDLERAFQGTLLTNAELSDRKHAYVYYSDPEGTVSLLVGDEAAAYVREFDAKRPATNTESVQGISAHTGAIVRGKIRLIKSDYSDFSNTERAMASMAVGDILLSPTTAPDLMPAFRKAAAIITDAGGMLSHAGITARELNLPCIVGTRNATSVFRDGDLVEVDTERGIVRKI